MPDYPLASDVRPEVTAFVDPGSNTISYVVADPGSRACAVIDAVLDFDQATGRIGYAEARRIEAHVREKGLELEWIIETHVHADHLSAAPWLQERLGGRIGIGAAIRTVQDTFGKVFNEGTRFARDGSQFDALFEDGDTYRVGTMTGRAMATPGHTPACMAHVIGDAAFVGDTLFMPDAGSARADFPGGDAGTLYDSVRRLLTTLPGRTRLFVCHDYGPGGREIAWETTVAEQRRSNIHVADGIDRETFVRTRIERDATLPVPKLIIPSLQVNMRAGRFPTDEAGNPRLTIPINGL